MDAKLLFKDGTSLAREEVMERLREVCGEREINVNDINLFSITDSNFELFGISKGSYMVMQMNVIPSIGDYTFIVHKNKRQLVLLSGKDDIGRPIICRKCITFPDVYTLPKHLKIIGIGIACINSNNILYLA